MWSCCDMPELSSPPSDAKPVDCWDSVAAATLTDAGWCVACITISTSEGFRRLSVMAREDASSTAGMWSSVWMCDGMASESSAVIVLSWTSRSKIWDVAGERWRGDAERRAARLGEPEKGLLLRRGLPITCDIAVARLGDAVPSMVGKGIVPREEPVISLGRLPLRLPVPRLIAG